ncbi:Hypothetical protein A7982_04148 [Minicystis rosea]|nr:Hypothetical protein A7982_04148 [Minicystis rosea]
MKKLALLALGLATLAGCHSNESMSSSTSTTTTTTPDKTVLKGDLDLDIRHKAHVELTVTEGETSVAVSLSQGHGVLAAETPITGTARIEAFPEAALTLYTARLDAPAEPSGPCGAQPISLALSLSRRGNNRHVGGSLTAYCGAGTWHGAPARLLRLAGDMPLKE